MDFLNLGVLAHVDAGKTSLTERLLHTAGAITELGSVDAGTTQTDSLALERRRGITIKAAVTSFVIDGRCVNLIDTPGHPEFIAEVERTLSVLDGVVLVISAVEGVQPQTRILMRAVQRLGLPAVLFVNKIDRTGADPASVLAAVRRRLSPAVVPMGTVERAGDRTASFRRGIEETTAADVLADNDEELLRLAVDGDLSTETLQRGLMQQSQRAQAYAVFFGSAITGAGVDELMRSLPELLPAAGGDPSQPLAARVFKIDRSASGARRAYLRVFDGGVMPRRALTSRGPRPTAVETLGPDGVIAGPGSIVRLRGVPGLRVGDEVGRPRRAAGAAFGPPTMQAVISPLEARDRTRLFTALGELADQDPLIDVHRDPGTGELAVSLYGEVQKQVIAAQLAEEHGLEVRFGDAGVVCIERVTGRGAAVEFINTDTNPLLATVGLRIEPRPPGSGVSFDLEVERGSMPAAFFRAVQDSLPVALGRGPQGWAVTDCAVTMTHSGYWARQSHAHGTFDKSMSSTAGDFRELTCIVLARAVRRAGTQVCEPIERMRLDLPVSALSGVLALLSDAGAIPDVPVFAGSEVSIEAELTAARVPFVAAGLAGATSGEGLLESRFSHYAAAHAIPPVGRPPRRPVAGNRASGG